MNTVLAHDSTTNQKPGEREQAPTVQVSGLDKTFRRRRENVHVLRSLDLQIANGELLVLLGPSGCGKTTLLRCLVGLERPTAGRIELDGRTVVDTASGEFVPPNHRDVGMVFQNYALWPHMTVAQNVAYPLRARGLREELRGGRVDQVLDIVQCRALADRYPPELSGGQQQRVSLARALAPSPALLLLDEPLSNLDALLRIELRAQLRLLHRQLGFTGVYVTHDQEEALALGTRVAVMREGGFDQIDTPRQVHSNPATEYVAQFLGARNRLAAEVDAHGEVAVGGTSLGRLVQPGSVGPHHLRLRPAQLRLCAAESERSKPRLRGARVVERLPGSDSSDYVLEYSDDVVHVVEPHGRSLFAPGDTVDIEFDPAGARLYDADSRLVRPA